MAATSVTGKGLGSAVKKQKGSEHLSIGAEKVIGPRVVYAAGVTLDGSGDLVIKLPELAGTAGNYVVVATDSNAAAAGAVAAALTIGGGATTITLKGPANSTVNVIVCKAGLAV